MLRLIVATLWRRRTQTVLLFLVALVAAGGAATAPGYVLASRQSLAVAAAEEAPPADRVVTTMADAEIGTDLEADLAALRTKVIAGVALPAEAVVGATTVAVLDRQLYTLAYREDVCAHLVIEGSCPQAAGELLLPQEMAVPADVVGIRGRTEIAPIPMRVVGRYRALNPNEAYWGRVASATESLAQAGLFTPAATFAMLRPNRAELGVDLIVPASAYRDREPQALADAAALAQLDLAPAVTVTSALGGIADRLRDEQRTVVTGTVVGVGELLVAAWLALFVAVRRTADARRGDIGLLKLRGARRRDLWALVAAQSLLPLLLAGLVGARVGPVVARWLVGPVSGPDDPLWTLPLVAAALAVLAAAVVAAVAEGPTLAAPVASLTRHTGLARPGWTAWLLDGVLVLLAVAGVYQSVASGRLRSGTGPAAGVDGVALLAPLLVALAVGILAARLLAMAAVRFGVVAVREGRLGSGLAALHLGRRTGPAGGLGVIVVVVATLVTTTLAWTVAAGSSERAAVAEVGAARVLTVRAAGPAQLLDAVRAVDASGAVAMAVVRTEAPAGPVLAVDTTRLAAVAPLLDTYGIGDWPTVAAALRPAGFEPAVLNGPTLTVDATWRGGPAVGLAARVVTASGPVEVQLGTLQPGRRTYAAAVPSGRLASIRISSTVEGSQGGADLTVHSLNGESGLLADRGHWRASIIAGAQVPEIAAKADGLSIVSGHSGTTPLDVSVFVVDAPTPLPVLQAGEMRVDRSDPRAPVVGNDVLPVRVVSTAQALPRVGSGLLADLEYADRLTVTDPRAVMQVWLADDAPATIDQDLADLGVASVDDETIAGRSEALRSHGPAAALRFLLMVAFVMLGLAALSFAVSTATERGPRAAELAALRRQGLPAAMVWRVGLVGYGVVAVVAVLLGLLTGVLLRIWLPVPSDVDGVPLGTLAGVGAGAVAIFGAVALAGAAGLAVTARRLR